MYGIYCNDENFLQYNGLGEIFVISERDSKGRHILYAVINRGSFGEISMHTVLFKAKTDCH